MIASRHGNFPVKKGDKVAGMRVVPLVIEEEKMEQVNRMCGNEPIFTILPFCQMKSGGRDNRKRSVSREGSKINLLLL